MKALFSGIAMAASAGLLMGAAMKPNLRGDDRPEGPQMFLGWSAARSTGPFDDGGAYAAYQGQTPDYVVGTDWTKRPVVATDVDYEPAPSVDYYAQAAAERTHYAQPTYVEPPREPVAFPSMAGGKAYGEKAPAHEAKGADTSAAAPGDAPFDEDAPPEATGDTTRVPS